MICILIREIFCYSGCFFWFYLERLFCSDILFSAVKSGCKIGLGGRHICSFNVDLLWFGGKMKSSLKNTILLKS